MLLLLEINDYNNINVEKNNIDKLNVIEIIENEISTKYKSIVAEIEEDKFVIILNCTKSEIENVLYLAHTLNEELTKHLCINATIGIGSFCYDITNLHHTYAEAEESLESRKVNECNEVIYIKDVTLNYGKRYVYPKDKEIELLNHIRKGDSESSKLIIHSITVSIQNHEPKIHYHQAQQVYFQILSSLINTVYSMGTDIESIFEENINLYGTLMKKENISEITDFLNKIVTEISVYINEAFKEKNNQHIECIFNIIKNNCGNNITLNTVAEQLHMNPSYISRIFKQNVGMTFMEYLTQVRLNKSKELLTETNLTIKEIGIKLGYNNSYYFIKLFKDCIGITPGEYRKMHTLNVSP